MTGPFRYSWLVLLLMALLPNPLAAALVQTGNVVPNVNTWNKSSTDGRIGNTSDGSVTVNAGSSLASYWGSLGYSSGSTGTTTVTGTGSKWDSSYLFVGHSGNGTLTIESGGQVSDNRGGYLGYEPGSTGTATVTGTGSKWTNNSGSSLFVGYSGTGTLTIESGGQVISNTWGSIYILDSGSYLGYASGSTGAATVTGAGSKWTNNGNLYVGREGNGSITVSDGGEVVASTLFASLSDLHGNGTITAYGAVLDTDIVFDATHGPSQSFVSFGFGSGGTLNVTFSGGPVGAGYKQSGSLTISEGVNVTSSSGTLGYASGSTGAATVTGTGSKWINSGGLYVGRSGSGTLTIEAGGEVGNTAGYTYGYLGYESGSTGTATVTGTGSKWINSGGLYVGRSGNGALTIEAGGQVSNANGYLGGYSNLGSGSGTAIVTGTGSKWTNSGDLIVGIGTSGIGTLTIEDGGLVSSSGGYLGHYYSGSTGTVTVTGVGSKWINSGNLGVGRSGNGTGTLTIEDGGLVSVAGTLTTNNGSLGTSFINMTTGGMLALSGDADDSLSQFLGLVQGTDAIRFWDNSLSSWAPLTSATLGVDYSLEYLTTGDLAGYTLLTVGEAISLGLPGDFNGNGVVDAADYVLWRKNPGSFGGPTGYDTWRDSFGMTAGNGAGSGFDHLAAVPEPTALFLAMAACLSGYLTRNRRS